MAKAARARGFAAISLGGRALAAAAVQRRPRGWDHWERVPVGLDVAVDARRIAALADAARGASLLVVSSTCPWGAPAHALSGVPWLTACVTPAALWMPPEYEARTPEAERAIARVRRDLRAVYARLGLPPPARLERARDPRRVLFARRILLGCSPAFWSAARGEALSGVRQTGFWLHDDPSLRPPAPDDPLVAWLARGAPPLVLTFSSLPVADRRDVLARHVAAAKALGLRLLVQSGWAGFTAADLPRGTRARDVRVVGELPHDWLFARAAAAIVHGGVGTIARGLRAGCPLLVEPYGNDQFWNALRVVELGAGGAVHPHTTSPDTLARVLAERVLRPSVRRRVAALGRRITREDGSAEAADYLARIAARGR